MKGAREAGDGDAGRGVRLNMHHPINTKFPTNWDLQGKREVAIPFVCPKTKFSQIPLSDPLRRSVSIRSERDPLPDFRLRCLETWQVHS